jgi:hypothetical protein
MKNAVAEAGFARGSRSAGGFGEAERSERGEGGGQGPRAERTL